MLQAAEAAVHQLEHKLQEEGKNWRLQFVRAKRAPQESFSEQFKLLARFVTYELKCFHGECSQAAMLLLTLAFVWSLALFCFQVNYCFLVTHWNASQQPESLPSNHACEPSLHAIGLTHAGQGRNFWYRGLVQQR